MTIISAASLLLLDPIYIHQGGYIFISNYHDVGKDVLAKAKTGTGKTASFLVTFLIISFLTRN